MRRNPFAKFLVALLALGLAAAGVVVFPHTPPGLAWEADRLARLLEIKPGMTIAELGAGGGHMAVRMAERVGWQGRVFATEVSAGQRHKILKSIAAADVENVTVVQALDDSANLPAGCCDVVFMRNVYHHLTSPAAINASILESLRPGGQVAVIDFAPSRWQFWLRDVAGTPRAGGGHGVTPEQVIEGLTAAGFELTERRDDWSLTGFLVVARKSGR